MTPEQIDRLIRHLQAAAVTTFDTYEGRVPVCKPKYLLTRDRDFIIGLLQSAMPR